MRWLILLLLLPTVQAIDCGDVITQDVQLTGDLDCPDTALATGAPGVHIDCQSNTLRGRSAGTAVHVRHDGVMLTDCNIMNFFTGVTIHNAQRTHIRNTFIQNTSTGIQVQESAHLFLERVHITNSTYYDLYAKDVYNFTPQDFDAQKVQVIRDKRPPEPMPVAEPENYTFRSRPIPLRQGRIGPLIRRRGWSLQDFRYAYDHLRYNTTVQQEEQRLIYRTDVTAEEQLTNLTILVYFPDGFDAQYVRSPVQRQGNVLRFTNLALEENDTKTLRWEVTTLLPREQWTLPQTLVFHPRPPRPSPLTARWILFAWFCLAAGLFLIAKWFLLRQPVTIPEQIGLLFGVLAFWSFSYQFTLEILRFTREVIVNLVIVALSMYYFIYVYRHRHAFES